MTLRMARICHVCYIVLAGMMMGAYLFPPVKNPTSNWWIPMNAALLVSAFYFAVRAALLAHSLWALNVERSKTEVKNQSE